MRSFPSMRGTVKKLSSQHKLTLSLSPKQIYQKKVFHQNGIIKINSGKQWEESTLDNHIYGVCVKEGKKAENNYQRPLLLSENSDLSSFTKCHSQESRFWNLNCCIISSFNPFLLRQLSRPRKTF